MSGTPLTTLCRHSDDFEPTWVWPVLCVRTDVLHAAARLVLLVMPVWTAVAARLCLTSGNASDA